VYKLSLNRFLFCRNDRHTRRPPPYCSNS